MQTADERRAKQRASYKKWYERNKESARKKKAAVMRRLRAESPEKYAAQSRKAKRRLRERLLEMYGARCSLCGFSDARALTLDHVRNNGAEERRELGERGVYLRALDGGNSDDYRIICMNCQFICRHEAGRQNQHPAVAALAWETLIQ